MVVYECRRDVKEKQKRVCWNTEVGDEGVSDFFLNTNIDTEELNNEMKNQKIKKTQFIAVYFNDSVTVTPSSIKMNKLKINPPHYAAVWSLSCWVLDSLLSPHLCLLYLQDFHERHWQKHRFLFFYFYCARFSEVCCKVVKCLNGDVARAT